MEKPEDEKAKTDFEDIKQAFDAALAEQINKTDDGEKCRELKKALREK